MRRLILLVNFSFLLIATYSQSPDPSFAGKGYTDVNFAAGNFYYESSVQVLPGINGSYYVLFHVNGFPVLSQHFANGERNPGFGRNGYSQTIHLTQAKAAVQPDGKIVIAGETFDPVTATADFGIARFNSNGTLDNFFAGDGLQAIDFFNSDDAATSILVQPDGKIVVAGRADDPESGRSHFALARLNADGAPDTSFDGDGRQVTDFAGGYDEVNAIAFGPGQKIVAAGETFNPAVGFSCMAVARYNADGSPDKTFGSVGKTATGFSGRDAYTHGVVVQANGKIVLAGQLGQPFLQNSAIALVRYNVNGTLDNTFNDDGKATTALFDSAAVATSLALQPDGRLVIGGYAFDPKSGYSDFIVARYTTTGKPDSSFSKNGFVTTDFNGEYDEVSSIFIQPDGKILASGVAFNTKAVNGDYALARYQPDGSPDRRFGDRGSTTGYYEASSSRMNAVAVQPDGKVVVAGGAYEDNRSSDFGLARYNTNGKLDKSFGDEGKITTDFLNDFDEVMAVAIQPDGKIVAAGLALNNATFINEFAIARYYPDGRLDRRFGRNGRIVTDLKADNNSFGGLTLQPDGKIIVAGAVTYEGGAGSNIILLRYTKQGEPDRTFNGDGKVITDFPSLTDEFATSVALQSDDKIVVSGYGFLPNSSNFILARYNVNGTLDGSFDGNGRVVTAFSSDVYALGMAIQPDGKILVGGDLYHFETDDYDFALARYNSNGSPDKTFHTDGRLVTDFGGVDNSLTDLGLQQDGKILVLGLVYNKFTGMDEVSLTRYTTSGVLDNSFDGDGSMLARFPGYYHYPTALAIRNNKAFATIAAYLPEQTSFLAAFLLGDVCVAPRVANQLLKMAVEKVPVMQLSVKALPNPSTQQFSLFLKSERTATATVRIFDAGGRLVETKTGVAANSTLQIGHYYKPGVYYAELVQDTSKLVITLVKQ